MIRPFLAAWLILAAVADAATGASRLTVSPAAEPPLRPAPSVLAHGPRDASTADTLDFGYYTLIGGQPFAVPGGIWSFDHAAPDPLEGWTTRDRSEDTTVHLTGLSVPEWLGSEGNVQAPIYSGLGALWCGASTSESMTRCWPSTGRGYGNLWRQRVVSPSMTYDGSGSVTLGYRYFTDSEFGYDFTRVGLVFADFTELPLNGTGWSGKIGSPGAPYFELDGTIVSAGQFAGHTQFRLFFEFTSDHGWSDEDGLYDSDYGAFGADVVTATNNLIEGNQAWDFEPGASAVATWSTDGEQVGAQYGLSICGVGDVNGDGFGDVAVGAPGLDITNTDDGRGYLYLGSANGLATTTAWTRDGGQPSVRFADRLAPAGDVNGDGKADLLVGVPRYDGGLVDEGRIQTFHGQASGLSALPQRSIESNQADAQYGYAVASANVNGDAYDDVIVGAPYFDNGQPDEGHAFVYLGSALGLTGGIAWRTESDQNDAHLGIAVGGAGDVNGDGFDDVLVGASSFDNGQSNEGAAWLYLGSGSGVASTAAWAAEGNQVNASFGFTTSGVGDVNADGFDDIMIGAPTYSNGQASEGRAYLYLGSALGLSTTAAWTAEADQANAFLGARISPTGDVNADGYSDVLVSAPDYDNGQTDEGRVYLYLGTINGLTTIPAWTGEGNQVSAEYGSSLAGVDVDNDGRSDVIVGSWLFDNGVNDEGAAFVHPGQDENHEGWTWSLVPGVGSQIGVAAKASYTFPGPLGPGCGLAGNVLEFHDAGLKHPVGQWIQALSPIVDLSGVDPTYQRIEADWDMYTDLPQSNGVFYRTGWKYYPYVCPYTGQTQWSDRVGPTTYYYTGSPVCASEVDIGSEHGVPCGAQQVRFVYELYASCDAFGVPPSICTIASNGFSPLLDNVRVRVTRDLGLISGHVFDDSDASCSKNGVEQDLAGRRVLLHPVDPLDFEDLVVTTDSLGYYSFGGVPAADYDLILLPEPYWIQTCPAGGLGYDVAIDGDCVVLDANTFDFGSRSVGPRSDLGCAFAGGQLRPGFRSKVYVSYVNTGTTAVSGATLELDWQPMHLEFVGGSSPRGLEPIAIVEVEGPEGADGTGSRITWNIGSLPSGESGTEEATFRVSTSATHGTPVAFTGRILPTVDEDSTNNGFNHVEEVVVAIDPNDMAVNPEGKVPANVKLTYRIRFQNIGSAQATNVVVLDTLETGFEMQSVRFVGASHRASFEMLGRVLRWKFKSIDLPDSLHDEPASHGEIVFTVNPRTGVPPGTHLANRASIKFDFNAPILTNTVVDTIAAPAEAPETPSVPADFALESIWPNPSMGATTARFALPESGHLQVGVYDVRGRRVRALASGQHSAGPVVVPWDGRTDTRQRAPSGVYFVRGIFEAEGRNYTLEGRMVVL